MGKLNFEVKNIRCNVPGFLGKYEEEAKILFINEIYKKDKRFTKLLVDKINKKFYT